MPLASRVHDHRTLCSYDNQGSTHRGCSSCLMLITGDLQRTVFRRHAPETRHNPRRGGWSPRTHHQLRSISLSGDVKLEPCPDHRAARSGEGQRPKRGAQAWKGLPGAVSMWFRKAEESWNKTSHVAVAAQATARLSHTHPWPRTRLPTGTRVGVLSLEVFSDPQKRQWGCRGHAHREHLAWIPAVTRTGRMWLLHKALPSPFQGAAQRRPKALR